jgi:hypothetical protein
MLTGWKHDAVKNHLQNIQEDSTQSEACRYTRNYLERYFGS